MPILNAVASSLVAVALFGLSTSANYAAAGLVEWSLAGWFSLGGVVGGWAGTRFATRLAARKGALDVLFATVILLVAGYMFIRHLAG